MTGMVVIDIDYMGNRSANETNIAIEEEYSIVDGVINYFMKNWHKV